MKTALGQAHDVATDLPIVDAAGIDAFLVPRPGEPSHAILFFAGAAGQRPETADVAVILPQLLRKFSGQLRGAIIADDAEDALKARFQVFVTPSLAMTRGAEPMGVLPKIQDWAVYVDKISAWLRPDAPALARPKPDGRVEFVFAQRSGS
jgi:hydrogenase-1 operon protein HyaE